MLNNSLPSGWAAAAIKDALRIESVMSDGDWVESKDQDPSGNIRLIQLADIGDGDFRNKSKRFMNQEAADRLNCTYLQKGDVLIARMPDPLGRACIFPGVGQESVTVVDVCLVRCSEGSAVSSTILKHWINSPSVRNAIALQATGTTRKRITRKKLEALELPLPPLAEQQQIAARLDALLAQVDTLKTRLDSIPSILKRFRQSVLSAAVSGRLTEEWRGAQGGKHEDWQEITFSKLLDTFRGGASKRPSDTVSGVPVIRSSAVRSMSIDFTDVRYFEETADLNEQDYVRHGDLLFTRLSGSAEYVGVCALVNALPSEQTQYPDRLFCARLRDPSLARYLEIFFASRRYLDYIQSQLKSSAGHQRITTKVVKDAQVILPPFEEQTEIVRRVEQLFAFADQIEQRVKDAQSRVNHLTQSILAKAFRGELTAEWREQNPDQIRGENSAEALLERIKAERATMTSKKGSRRKKAG